MSIEIAKTAGFCFGVERAIELAYSNMNESDNKKIYTYGPLIHNATVIDTLKNGGVGIMNEDSDFKEYDNSTIIVRSHGVGREVYDKLNDNGCEIIDATCPYVTKIHKTVEKYSKEGYFILIAGDANHPEVRGIMGWVVGDDYATIMEPNDIEIIDFKSKPIYLVAQTTFNYNKFDKLVEIIKEKGYDINVLNTICGATRDRQTEAADLASRVDVMIVIGDKSSSNSQKLFEICKKKCDKTYFVQTADDLDGASFHSNCKIGITAGASTPKNIIEEVFKECQK